MPSHYLTQCWIIVEWTIGNTFQRNLNWNFHIFIQENVFENVVWNVAAILSRSKCVNSRFFVTPPCYRVLTLWYCSQLYTVHPRVDIDRTMSNLCRSEGHSYVGCSHMAFLCCVSHGDITNCQWMNMAQLSITFRVASLTLGVTNANEAIEKNMGKISPYWNIRKCEPHAYPDNKVYGANMGPTRGRQDPGGPMLAPWTLLSG